MSKGTRISSTAFVACCLLACATSRPPASDTGSRGDVSVRAISDDVHDSYNVENNDVRFVGPSPLESNKLPVYPASLLSSRLPPQELRVRIIVNEAGFVTEVTTPYALDGDQMTFFTATAAALKGWAFMPLVKVESGIEATTLYAHGKQLVFGGKATAMRFRQDYKFTFAQRNGRGVVETAEPQD